MEQTIPYKIYLEEQEMPKQWYNVRADMKKKPAPILNPQTLKPVTVDELSAIFCTELAKQEPSLTAYGKFLRWLRHASLLRLIHNVFSQ